MHMGIPSIDEARIQLELKPVKVLSISELRQQALVQYMIAETKAHSQEELDLAEADYQLSREVK